MEHSSVTDQERPSTFRPVEIIREGPWQVGRKHVTDTIKERQDRLGVAQFTPHDLRRTALTKMAELGVAPIVLGHIANHRTTTKAGVTLGVYVQHAYERESGKPLSCGLIGWKASCQDS
jgi:integrase